MFDKYKARFAKFEEDHESVRKATQHVEKYQVVYATIGGSVVTLVAVRVFGGPQVIVKEAVGLPTVINNTVAPIIAPVMNNIGNQQTNTFGGPMTKMVKCLETGEMWETVTDAAEAAGTSMAYMSRHLNGHKDHLYNKHYKIIGLGTAD